MYRVLLGEISSNKAVAIARFLKKHYNDIYIISYDYAGFTKKVRSRFSNEHHVIPFVNRSHYVQELATLCRELRIDLFIPVHSNYIGDILQQKEMFGPVLNYVGTYETYMQLHDKKRMQYQVQKLGIPMPVDYPGFEQAIIPFVAKPTNLSSSKGITYFRTEEEKRLRGAGNYQDYIYQSYIAGEGCGYSVYASEGRIVVGYGHKRLMEYPVSGGSSVYRTPYEHPDMRKYAEIILANIKWSGFAMFEFKLCSNGILYLIEVNPRIWGSINQGLANGLNYFETLIPLPSRKEELKQFNTYMNPQIVLSALGYLKKGNLKPIKKFWQNRLNNQADIGILNDFKGYLSTVLRIFFK